MAEPCIYHVDHETRIKNLEATMKEVETKLGNPAVTVAIIGVIGTLVSGCCAFAGVVMAPVIRAWLGV